MRRWVEVAFDVFGFAFFFALVWYGPGSVEGGFSRLTMIYAIPKGYVFAGVPLAAAVACVQLALMGLRDFFAANGPASLKASNANG